MTVKTSREEFVAAMQKLTAASHEEWEAKEFRKLAVAFARTHHNAEQLLNVEAGDPVCTIKECIDRDVADFLRECNLEETP